MRTAFAVAVLVAVLAFAVVRPRGLPEGLAAVPAAVLLAVTGIVSWHGVAAELRSLGPTVGFLAVILVLGHLADSEGVFRYAGAVAARWSRGSPQLLLAVVFAVVAVVTAVLSLDATVVLLTPVVFATAAAVAVRPRPHVYACTHLANSASLLLPVSNLTNLVAFSASGLSFAAFAGLMAPSWLVAVAIEYGIFRWFFAADLATPRRVVPEQAVRPPVFALTVLGLTLAGFGVTGEFGVYPAWVALAAVVVLAVRAIGRAQPGRRWTAGWRLAAEANVPFLAFVFALGVVVLGVRDSGLGAVIATAVTHLVPGHAASPDLPGLLGAALLGAVLANLLNNLPATLLLVPLVAHSPGLVLAVLAGVNIGPNLSYAGSLATLLWRQVMERHLHPPAIREFLRLGALTVPACLAGAVAVLWLSLLISGVK
jgi:arsenical pump membrane protein